MSLISIVVPVYHNAASLPNLLIEFQRLSQHNSEDGFEFIFVDDGSRDNSYDVLCRLQQEEPRIRIVKLSRNFGSNAALLAGMTQARGDVIGVIAADLQDPPELFNTMLESWRQGNKVMLAVREDRDDPGMTTLLADNFYALFRRFAIKSMPKRGFDFFMIDKQVNDIITHIQENNAYLMGQILWVGFNPVTFPYHRVAREARYGKSMWTFIRKIKYFVDAFVAFSHIPVRAASVLGIGLSILGLIYAGVILIARLFIGIPIEGWTSLMIVLLVVSGVQMIMMGILGEYLVRNLDETRKRPRFIIEEVRPPSKSEEL